MSPGLGLGLGLGLTRNKGGGVATPADLALIAKYAQPAMLFDFSKTDRTFQDATGQTLADDAGEAVALALDEAQWGGKSYADHYASQPENVVNGGLDSPTGYTINTGTECGISGGTANFNTAGTINNITQALPIDAGDFYRRKVTIKNWVSGFGQLRFNGGATVFGSNMGANGNYDDIQQAGAGNTGIQMIRSSGTWNASYDDISVKKIAGKHGVQSGSTGARPTRQANGLKGDGSDDNFLLPFMAGAGANVILIDADVPASLSGIQIISGATGAGGALRLQGGAFDTAGLFCGGVGNQNATVIKGTRDYRGTRCLGALVADGSTVKLLTQLGGLTPEYSAAQDGSPVTNVAWRLFTYNLVAGTAASNFFAGTVRRVMAIQAAPTDAEILSILNYWSSL